MQHPEHQDSRSDVNRSASYPDLAASRLPHAAMQAYEPEAPLTAAAPTNATLIDSINRLKREKNAVILAHYYQESGIQDIADYIGDSLGLAQQGQKSSASIIVLAGVVFMAETAKILNPEKKVLCPDMKAGCSLADNCPGDKFKEFIDAHPGHTVVTYVNCSAEVKALSDILCTSSNAVKIIESIPRDQPIIFAPDKHLGSYLKKKTGRDMVLWDGSCMVHELFDAKRVVQMKARHPQAEVIAHPECPESVLGYASFIGSTAALLRYTKESKSDEFIVITEAGILHQMRKASPTKTFYPMPNREGCDCAECPYMRLNSMQKIEQSLRSEQPEIHVPEEIRRKALIPLERMLALS